MNKNTKRAFTAAVISLLLCISMLIGTTFAWFTDAVTVKGNKIQAGTLKIGLEQYKDGTWEDISDSTAPIFPDEDLWEPGFTKAVLLKVSNKGNLALKFAAYITANDAIEVNENGHSLADAIDVYTKIGATESDLDNMTKFNATGLTPTSLKALVEDADGAGYGELLPSENSAATVLLLLHMREDAGNEYQGMSLGTAFDVKIQAVQLSYEADSFGPNYDEFADGNPDHPEFGFIAPTYQISKVETTGNVKTANTGDSKVTEEATLTSKGNVDGEKDGTPVAKATIPEGVVTTANAENESTELTLVVTPVAEKDAPNITIATDNGSVCYDISVEGVDNTNNTEKITVGIFIGKGLDVKNVYHETTAMDAADYSYNPTTGILTIKTATFSKFTVEYDNRIDAKVGNTVYANLADAVAAATNGKTEIFILNDVKDSAGIPTNDGQEIVIDLQGHTFAVNHSEAGSSGTKNQCFQLLQGSTVTIKNGTLAANSNALCFIIQNYSNLTLEKVTLDGSSLNDTRESRKPYTISNNCGTVTIKDCVINASTVDPDGAFALDSCKNGSYTVPAVTLTGKTVINGNIELSGGKLIVDNGVVINGKILKANGYTDGDLTIGGKAVKLISTADELAAFAAEVNNGTNYSGKTVMLTADIDLSGKTWTPIGKNSRFQGTFDGQNFTISNLSSIGNYDYGNGLFGDITGNAVLKNFTVYNAEIKNTNDGKGNVYGIVCGYAYGNATFENITVTNSKVSGFGKVGAILGMAADAGGVTTVKNCVVKDTEIKGAYNCAPFIGLAQNKVECTGCTSSANWAYSSRYGADSYVKISETSSEGKEAKGTYWIYPYNDTVILYTGWGENYNTLLPSEVSATVPFNGVDVAIDGYCH